MKKESTTRYAILGLLTYRSGSGYDLKQAFHKPLGYFWDESYGQIYPALKQLLAEGSVKLVSGDSPGRREKKVYAITPKGEKELSVWLAAPTQADRPRLEVLLKLFFSQDGEVSIPLGHLRDVETRHQKLLEEYAAIERLLLGLPQQGHTPFQLITLRCGIRQSEAMAAWARESMALLEGGILSETARPPEGRKN
ncbi:MAG: PadR family transcriptional regulator [Deltaproteobacteria bacterium]|nr:PadR family transcriptional regulator [Deltaproteobacteria bacterium]